MSTDTAMDRLRAANPAPDTRLLREESEDLAVLLATTWQRSTNMQTTQQQGVEPPQGQRRRGWLIAAAAFAVVIAVGVTASLLSSPGTDAEPVAPAAGPVTFTARINLSASPVVGTFRVNTGADVLGCSSGTVVQVANPEWIGNNIMTCDSGPNTGTFTVDHGSEDVYVWSVVETSDDFAGLQGEGTWDFVLTSSSTVVETFTGDIEYAP